MPLGSLGSSVAVCLSHGHDVWETNRPGKSWALSYIDKNGKFSHQLILQDQPGAVLKVGAADFAAAKPTDLAAMIDLLRSTPGYM